MIGRWVICTGVVGLLLATPRVSVVAWGGSHGARAGATCGVQLSLGQLGELDIFAGGQEPFRQSPPVFPDLVYEYKLARIGAQSPIHFDYNDRVRRYIEIFTLERREQVAQMLGLAQLYFPMFDEHLDRHNLPLELRYVAVVESALNPLAVSPTGAVGLWQFKLNTGRMFNLQVSSYIDQRMDPVLSTDAACRYLSYLYQLFRDWHLAMAAYNVGPGAVRNAILRSGGETNFWRLLPYLPVSAQNFVPAIIAAAYVMRHAGQHGIEPIAPLISYAMTDTVRVGQPVALGVLAEEVGVPLDVILFLNPVYRRAFVPIDRAPAPIRLPEAAIARFFERERTIYARSKERPCFHEVLSRAGSTANRVQVSHTVAPGEFLHMIALRYGCTVDDIHAWNPHLGHTLQVGQVLTIWTHRETLDR